MSTNRFLTIASGVRRLVTAISASVGVGDANKIVATDSTGRLDSSLLPSGVGPLTLTIVASEALAASDLINIWNNSGTRNARKADASNTRPAHGFVLSSVSNGGDATVYLQGELTGLTGLTIGQVRFLSSSAAGQSTATAPAATAILQEVGVAVSTTSILFEYDGYTEQT